MNNYQIVSGHIQQVQSTVDNMIQGGWIPAGGICPGGGGHVLQAMWRSPQPMISPFRRKSGDDDA